MHQKIMNSPSLHSLVIPIAGRLYPLFAAVLTAAGLAACASKPAPAPVPAVPPAAVLLPAPEPPPPAVPAAVSPAAQQSAQKLAQSAVELLDAGNEDQALGAIDRPLASDPNNVLADKLLRQITADPVATLGRESWNYTVRSGESLSTIAGRYMGDIQAFYILARYNDIKVPRQLTGGQVVKVPGKQPSAAQERELRRNEAPPPPPPRPPSRPEPRPDSKPAETKPAETKNPFESTAPVAPAPAAPVPATAPPPPPPPAAPPAPAANPAAERQAAIRQATQNARAALARQDLVGCIREWNRVLALDPGHPTATFERQRCVDLKEKADKLPK
jgi:hypothetical protein